MEKNISFSDVLASSVHDIKNSLGMVTNTIEELALDPRLGLAGHPGMMRLQLEAQRVNHDLIQMLLLYKFENRELSANITETDLEDFLEDIAIEHLALAEARGIRIETRSDPQLRAYFDENLIRSVINNAIGNAQRYTRDRILISAETQHDYIVLRVEDNGEGFPDAMLAIRDTLGTTHGFMRCRTQLGLYFATMIAGLHSNQDRKGHIRVENHHALCGGCFSLWLP
jgi:signal transduction histidine kinase